MIDNNISQLISVLPANHYFPKILSILKIMTTFAATNQLFMTKIQLSDHFNYKRLLRFTIPSMMMMIFTSIYGVVDGFCVSNLVGKDAFAALNLIMPFPMLCSALGMMLGTGGAAYIARTLGRGQKERAQGILSMVVIVAVTVSLLATLIGVIFMPQIAKSFGANDVMLPLCITYGRIFMLGLAPFILQNIFQVLLVTAERPNFGLFFIVAAGITNIVLDLTFMGVFHWGIAGAAWATVISCVVGGFGPLVYFLSPNKSLLRLIHPLWDMKALRNICWNGSSEMVIDLSIPICSILYNLQLMRMLGEDGVSAYGVIMYVNFIFMALFIGYLMGLESIIGYHYGAKNQEEVQNLRYRSIRLMTGIGLVMCGSAELCAPLLSHIFVGYDAELAAITTRAFRLYSLAFLIMGYNAMASSLFTALGNGLISAIISFCRTFLFQALAVLLLPLVLGLDGIWLAMFVGEVLCLCVSGYYYKKYKERYGY